MKLSDETLQRLKTDLPELLKKVVDHYSDAVECSFCSGYERARMARNGYYTLYNVEIKHDDDCLGIQIQTELDSQE